MPSVCAAPSHQPQACDVRSHEILERVPHAHTMRQNEIVTSMKSPPRAYAPDPSSFGRVPRRRGWTPVPQDPHERACNRAAQVQDAAAGLVFAGLKAKRYTRADLQARTGWGRERLSRLMNGNIPAGLDDVMLLLDAAGISFSAVAWPATAEQHRERQRLTDVQEYLARMQRQVAEGIARIEQERPKT